MAGSGSTVAGSRVVEEVLMCSYCGCEAEPSITALIHDHAVIADLAYRVDQGFGSGDAGAARSLMVVLAERFRVHSLKEEAGLFAELARRGEAPSELQRLLADHNRLRALLASPGLADRPHRLRAAIQELAEHTEIEDNDLFPYALQVLPAEAWDRINQTAAQASAVRSGPGS
jgi:hemerythrin-like domain-containing protein